MTTLTLARARLTSLGFTVAPDARHPFGTGNCCVFFENQSYLEPITIADRNATDQAAAEGLFFVKRIKRFTERQGEGFAMLALTSEDAAADHAAFEKAGMAGGPLFRFSRQATLPDGEEREIGVALAYADAPTAPDATAFACQHLAKDILFQKEYLQHANGAAGVVAVVAVAEAPGEFRAFLSAVTGEAELAETASGLEVGLDRQKLLLLTPSAFRDRYGLDSPNPRRGMLFSAFELGVLDTEQAARYGGRSAKRHAGAVVVPAAPGLNTVLAFRSVSND